MASAVPACGTALATAFAAITEHWAPVVIGELNGQQVKAMKFQGAFQWHQHRHEDGCSSCTADASAWSSARTR